MTPLRMFCRVPLIVLLVVFWQFLLVTLSELVLVVGSSIAPIFDTVVEATLAASIHPYKSARVSAAFCLRSLSVVLQSHSSGLANKVVLLLMLM